MARIITERADAPSAPASPLTSDHPARQLATAGETAGRHADPSTQSPNGPTGGDQISISLDIIIKGQKNCFRMEDDGRKAAAQMASSAPPP